MEYDYKNMYNWLHDLPLNQNSFTRFNNIINYFNQNNKILNPKVLEIGTFVGTSIIGIVERIPNSIGTAIDPWKNYQETSTTLFNNMEQQEIEKTFYSNIQKSKLPIKGIKGDSTKILLEFVQNNLEYNFIYVDGSHLLLDCYTDLILSWKILRKNGILAIDDYPYQKEKCLESPYEAVNHFLNKFKDEYKILDSGYRVFLEKII